MVIIDSDPKLIAFGLVAGIGDRVPDSVIGLPDCMITMRRNPSEVAVL